MDSKKFHRLAITLIFLALLFNCFLPSLFYGYNNIGGSDEIRLFDKGKGVALGDVDLYHLYNQPEAIDVYPPGYSIIIAELITMVPGIDPYSVEYVYKAVFFGVALVLYFWLGLFFSRKMALAAVILRSCIFVVMVTRQTFYTYLLPYNFLIGGGNFTEIAILLTLIFILRFLNHIGSSKINIALIFLVGLLHGLTHISGFTSFTIFISMFLIMYAVALTIKGAQVGASPAGGIPRRLLGFIKSVFKNRVMMPVYVTLTLPLLIFLLYYLRLVIETASMPYILDLIMPLSMPIEIYISLMCFFAIIGVVGLVMGGREAPFGKSLPPLPISNFIWRAMIVLFLASFLLTVVLVNNNPNQYAYAIYAVISGFPSYIPGIEMGMVPVLTVVVGTFVLILSLIGAIGMGYRARPNNTFLAILFISSYWFFTVTFVLDILVPHRTLFFLVPLSLMVAMGILELPRSLEKCMVLIGRPFGKYTGRAFTYISANRHKIAAIMIVGFLAVGVVARANFEPIVRDCNNDQNPLQFGMTTSPLVTTELIEKVREVFTPGESVLCNPDTLTAIYNFVEINPASSPYWNVLLNVNSNYSDVFYSMNYFPNHSPSKWLTEHNGTLVILGMMDVNEGSALYGFFKINTLKFDNDPALKKVYENQWGELIYKLNVTA